jgi:hypothetical protein
MSVGDVWGRFEPQHLVRTVYFSEQAGLLGEVDGGDAGAGRPVDERAGEFV